MAQVPLEREVDFYGLLNISKTATNDQIQKKFRKLSLYTHPDKTIGRQSHEVFVQMQRAYSYLVNPTTRLIYDNYGTQGLKIFELFQDQFSELSDELRSQDIEDEQRQIIQGKILRKSKAIIRQHLKGQISNEYQKSFSIDLGVNLRSFSKNYYQFYYAGQLGRSLKLIRTNTFSTNVNFSLPLKKYNQVIDFSVQTQNDLKQGLGLCNYKVSHTYNYKPELYFKTEIGKNIINHNLFLKLKATITENGIMPSINLSSSQLAPYMCKPIKIQYTLLVDTSYNFGSQAFGIGLRKEEAGTNLAYSAHISLSKDDVNISPSLQYQLTKEFALSSSVSISYRGTLATSTGITFNVSDNKSGGVYFQSQHAQHGAILQSSTVVLVYNHYGYLFKVPIVTCNHQENKPGMIMSLGVFLAANVLFYIGFKYLKKSPSKQAKKDQVISYGRFYQKSENVNNYIRENQIFFNSSYNTEERTRGLIIIEAYYGLADHIYQIEAGTLIYHLPKDSQEFLRAQILPVTKQLQMQIQNSQLILESDFENLRGVFNPCVNLRSKTLLYLRYKYRDMENAVIYDFSRRELVIPRDLM
ncbi:UNKNOWN [Stylonychia lemnae]|uniref:J domain-containing protein n=1 Tax=Stylonychia lemnae TaxID=5949 RepID=A0A078A4U2_STYLE|nr:UNKNOWN [Stylonychia lemnae]|eukprot:CDW77285.1 UNKNOWN [Stylonychia lemnae]